MKYKNLVQFLLLLGFTLVLGFLFIDLPAIVGARGELGKGDTQTEDLTEALLQQGVSPECILGVAPDGIPFVCESVGKDELASSVTQQTASSDLPYGTRGWETIPSIIRSDGIDTFRLEIDTNGPVAMVRIDDISLGQECMSCEMMV